MWLLSQEQLQDTLGCRLGSQIHLPIDLQFRMDKLIFNPRKHGQYKRQTEKGSSYQQNLQLSAVRSFGFRIREISGRPSMEQVASGAYLVAHHRSRLDQEHLWSLNRPSRLNRASSTVAGAAKAVNLEENKHDLRCSLAPARRG